MARKLRIEFQGAIYHVTMRGVERRSIFRDDVDRNRFVEQLADSVERYGVRLYLYCLMRNHVHLLAETPKGNLSAFMQRLQTAYSVYFNLRHRRAGHLLQGRYGAQLVQGDDYLLRLSRYIHLNPVFVGGAALRPLDERRAMLRAYRWSSYRGYAGIEPMPKYVEAAPILAAVTGRTGLPMEKAYRKYVDAGLARTDAEFVELLKDTVWGIGDEEFRRKVEGAHREAVKLARHPEDISLRKVSHSRNPAEVLEAVGKVFGVKAAQLRKRTYGRPERMVAMELLAKHAGLNQREIARFMGVGTGSGVCRAISRLTMQRQRNAALDRACRSIDDLLAEQANAEKCQLARADPRRAEKCQLARADPRRASTLDVTRREEQANAEKCQLARAAPRRA